MVSKTGVGNRTDQHIDPVLIDPITSKAAARLNAWNGSCKIESNRQTQIIDTTEVGHGTHEDSHR
jgi:hypothetical protein